MVSNTKLIELRKNDIQGDRDDPEARHSSEDLVDRDVLRSYPSRKYKIAQELSNKT